MYHNSAIKKIQRVDLNGKDFDAKGQQKDKSLNRINSNSFVQRVDSNTNVNGNVFERSTSNPVDIYGH